MRNLKKLLAVVVAICVLATFTVPAFAADTAAAKTDAQIATDLGVIKGAGNGVTAEYLATQPDRLQGAIMFLRLKGLEDTAKAFIGTDNFSDVEGLSDTNKAILAYLKANPDLGFGGIGDNKFSPLTKMTAKEYYKVMLVALGYVYDTDFTWANVLSFAASKGLTGLIDNETFTVNDLCKGTVEALKATVKGGTDTLLSKLVDGGSITAAAATASGLYTAVPKALEVVSATADTLKTAKIVFNQELDSTTIKAANFSNSDVTVDPKLLDDKKTVIVVFNTVKAQSATADVVLENVKSASGTAITKVTKTITFVDTTIPVISGAVAKNAKSIVISASEPINFSKTYPEIISDIKIDGASAIADATIDYAKNTVTLGLSTALAAGTHKIDISNMKDFANYTAVATSFNVDVAADTTAPAITSAKVNNLKEIEVTFSEDVDKLSQGTFWVNGTEIPSVNVAQQDDRSKFKLTLASELNIAATVEIKIEYKGQKDVVGNEVKDKTAFTGFKVTDDTVLPTVTATIGSDNKITLTFSKTMYSTTTAGDAGTIKILKTSDKSTQYAAVSVVDGTFKADTNKTVIELTASQAGLSGIDPVDITVNIKDMKDGTIRKNALTEQNLALKALDTKKPSVTANFKATAGDTNYKGDYATFYFTEAMDPATLNSLSNYVLATSGASFNAIALSSLSDCSIKEVASDGKSVKITIPGIATAASPDQTFNIYALKDVAGNLSNNAFGISRLTGNTLSVTATPNAVETNKIEVVFNEAITSFDPSTFVIREQSAATTAYAFAIGYTVDVTKVSLTLNRDLGTNPTGYFIALNDGTKVKNAYGTTLASFTTVNVGDKVSPTASVGASTSSSILVTFSENVLAADANAILNNIVVRKASDNSLVAVTSGALTFLDNNNQPAAVGGFRKVQISELKALTDYTVEVLPRAITDASGNANVVKALAATTVTTN